MSLTFKKGFTLIEVLLVIAILAILASVVIIAINPSKQLAAARDAQRHSDVYSIMNALHQYALDHEGAFPDSLSTEQLEICKTDSPDCTDLYDLSDLTTDQKYLVSMPTDPLCSNSLAYCTQNGTGYFVNETATGRITVFAADTESDNDIIITQ